MRFGLNGHLLSPMFKAALVGCGIVLTAVLATPARTADLSVTPPHRYEIAPNASGFFIDLKGTVLTARHAVEGCKSLYLLKDGRVTRAELIAASDDADLALLRSTVTPLLAATFAIDDRTRANQPLFAAGYDELNHMPGKSSMIYNALALDRQSQGAELALYSDVDHGASGSPVLDGNGLVIGLIVKREAVANRGGKGVAIAVSGRSIKAFLTASGISFQDSNRAQLSPLQARAPRAVTLMAGVICG